VIGQTISHYRIVDKLGGGGMGVVYKAEDTTLKRSVALKFLPPELTRDPEAKERLIREAQAASALDHANICTVYEVGETNEGQLFIAMACYEAETLKKRIEGGPMPVNEATDIATQVGQGLAKAHEKGIVHRDIKPANIMITAEGVAKILDFGLAKQAGQTNLTRTGSTVGTAAYMSPEQARGEEVDHRTDIWSLGVMLYEMLTGQRAFKSDYEQALVYSILNQDPKPMRNYRREVPEELERIVKRAVAKNPEDRYQSVGEMLADLVTFEEGGQASGRRMSAKAGRTLSIVAASVIVTAVALVLYLSSRETEMIDSIAVLPFTNLSRDSTQEYFADGMTDELITKLSAIGGLRVPSYRSVMLYKNSTKPLNEIAKDLHVKAVVEPTVLRVGDSVRIGVKLIHAEDEKPIWSTKYDRELKDILALQGEVCQAIVDAIRVKITPQQQARLSHSHTVDPRAYELYLRALSSVKRNEPELASRQLELAIANDSSYAPAWTTLAALNVQARRLDLAIGQARKAVALDAANSSALYNLAYALEEIGNEEEALAWYKEAVDVDSLFIPAYCALANIYIKRNKAKDAVELLATRERMNSASPYSYLLYKNLGKAHAASGEYTQARASLERSLDLRADVPETVYLLATVYEKLSMTKESVERWQQYVSMETDPAKRAEILRHVDQLRNKTQ
jgi:serine/threonine protein kinase/tetratricopeptide (TPR) repeat protein